MGESSEETALVPLTRQYEHIYSVELCSGERVWTFSSDSPIHLSYEKLPNHLYIDCRDDWRLHWYENGRKVGAHTFRLGETPARDGSHMLALPMSQDEFMIRTSGHVESAFWPYYLFVALLPVAVAVAFFYRARPRFGSIGSDNCALTRKKRKHRKKNVNRQISPAGEVTLTPNSSENDITALAPNPSENRTSMYQQKIGKMVVTGKEIGRGSNGTIVLEGEYNGRNVAVKRMLRSFNSVAQKEMDHLIESDRHSNIIRWYGVEYDQDFVYICLERCTCTLFDLIRLRTSLDQGQLLLESEIQLLKSLGSDEELVLWKSNDHPSALLLNLMRDIVRGLDYLHDLRMVHRDLKPQNILVIKDRNNISVKLSDMGISKRLEPNMSSVSNPTGSGTAGWKAPEQLSQEREGCAVDLFALGCVLFFCLTRGRHPFGEDVLERDLKILNAEKDLFLIEHLPEATDLISRLLEYDKSMRPEVKLVLKHPLFWDSRRRLEFLNAVSERLESEGRRRSPSSLLQALESRASAVFGGRVWNNKIHSTVMRHSYKHRTYRHRNLLDLVRLIRNRFNHNEDNLGAILGPHPEGLDHYFSSRFPTLLIEVYGVIRSHCLNEDHFRIYF